MLSYVKSWQSNYVSETAERYVVMDAAFYKLVIQNRTKYLENKRTRHYLGTATAIISSRYYVEFHSI